MSLYQKIKSAITVRQVGEMYGMEPDRHGMVCCPFHSDSDPSMKLNDTYYYCFGCGANGDAIDLTAKLFDLNPRQAAEKLIHDFGLDPDKPPANAIALPPPKRGLTDEQRADIAYCLRVLTDYLDLLHDWQERYKPATPEEPHDPRFEEALHMTETIERLTIHSPKVVLIIMINTTLLFLKENHPMKKNISRNPLWPDWYNGKKIDEVQFGRAFLEQWPLKCVNGTLYTLDGPVEDESEIKQRILENIEEYVTSGLSKKVTNILETIKLLAFSDPFPIEQDCIHFQNGVYHLPDGTFQESRLFCQNRLPVKYDPKAASPDRWLTFLHELLDDADIPTLQEYLGYCLIPSTKGQKMMLIVGKGGEGKSRIGLVLKRLMGDAASNGSVQKVENNRFARADLERRLLMIDDDMDMNALPKTNYIKTIVTAEAKLDLERKGVQSYQRDIYARFLCFGNGALTSLYDHSDGFFRRQLILTTKDKPADRTDDPFLVEKMCAELEGILLWCLEGLHRLVQNDFRFTVSERAAANVDTIKRSSNNVIDFMESEGYFRFKADYSISSKEFYDIYKQWCEDNACHSVSAIRFSAELRQNDRRYNLEATNNIYLPGGRRVRGFVGIEPLVHPCP